MSCSNYLEKLEHWVHQNDRNKVGTSPTNDDRRKMSKRYFRADHIEEDQEEDQRKNEEVLRKLDV